jgi:hypothetical protein
MSKQVKSLPALALKRIPIGFRAVSPKEFVQKGDYINYGAVGNAIDHATQFVVDGILWSEAHGMVGEHSMSRINGLPGAIRRLPACIRKSARYRQATQAAELTAKLEALQTKYDRLDQRYAAILEKHVAFVRDCGMLMDKLCS